MPGPIRSTHGWVRFGHTTGSHQGTTDLTDALTPRWQDADEAVESLVATLAVAAAKTTQHSARKRPRGRAGTKRRPKSTRRHIAEVIRSHRLAPGLRVDRNTIAALLIGHRDLVTNPVLVVAVAQACSIIAGRKLSAKKAARMRSASIRVAELIASAEADTNAVPAPRVEVGAPPAPVVIAAAPRQSRRRPLWWLAAAVLLLIVVAILALAAALNA